MSSKKTAITIAVTTVALSLGSIGIATASSSKGVTKSRVSISSTAVTFGKSVLGAPGMGMHEDELATVLAALVKKGTLTQAQFDAITAALVAAHADRAAVGDAKRTAIETLITTTLGIDAATLQKRLIAGESLATIAGAKTAALIAALVAAETKEIDAAVTAGKLTAAQATTLKADLTVRVTAMVNATGEMRGPGHMGGEHMGGGMDNDGDHQGPNGGGMMGGRAPLTLNQ